MRLCAVSGLWAITKRAGVLFMGSSTLWKAAVGKINGEQGGEQVSPGAEALEG